MVLTQIVSELPASTSCNFDVQWCPKIPGVISASSFDVKIGLYNIEVNLIYISLMLTFSRSCIQHYWCFKTTINLFLRIFGFSFYLFLRTIIVAYHLKLMLYKKPTVGVPSA